MSIAVPALEQERHFPLAEELPCHLPSLLVGFSTTNFTRTWEPTLSWNELHVLTMMNVMSEEGQLPGCIDSVEFDIIPVPENAGTIILGGS